MGGCTMTSPNQLMRSVGLTPGGVVPWGTRVPLHAPGVYLASTSPDPHESHGRQVATIDARAVETLLRTRPEATVDGQPATVRSITERLQAIWVPGEPVVYIGLAGTSVTSRVEQYFATKIGARAPHSGGWPIKMMADIDRLWIHFTSCGKPAVAEKSLLRAFAEGLPDHVIESLHDRNVIVPFANLELTKGQRKAHGFRGVKEPRASAPASRSQMAAPPPDRTSPASAPAQIRRAHRMYTDSRLRTQIVTAADIAGGRIRIPAATKALFPSVRSTIDVELCGEPLRSRWDPKFGPDRERSGIVSVPKSTLIRLVQPGRQLTVTVGDGHIRIGAAT